MTLFAKRDSRRASGLREKVRDAYGLELGGVELCTVYTRFSKANNIVIAAYALARMLFRSRYDAVLSRNLFASFLLALVSRSQLIIEVHQVETGFRGWLQRQACRRDGVVVVAISNGLRTDLLRLIGSEDNTDVRVLHDAAPEAPVPLSPAAGAKWRRRNLGDSAAEDRFVCAYVGHLYPGRGAEIIEALARECPDILFLVIGGNESDLLERRSRNDLHNLRYLGHVPHPEARAAMGAADVLLMPYQDSVSIGLAGSDTARWMSPMKMFEYMASGTPFIASDIEVLREVLRDRENAILVPPANACAWKKALLVLRENPELRRSLAQRAFEDYRNHYTWRRRAERIIACLDE